MLWSLPASEAPAAPAELQCSRMQHGTFNSLQVVGSNPSTAQVVPNLCLLGSLGWEVPIGKAAAGISGLWQECIGKLCWLFHSSISSMLC